uniref:TIR domain-containing protein n=1 Tax=Solanum lycopersicum TaxID=4081 RepID=A0A494GAA1_SOLLC
MFHASSKVCKYDIFLSFRGEDTRRTFVSHLYNALEQRGIHAFKDDERLEAGQSLSMPSKFPFRGFIFPTRGAFAEAGNISGYHLLNFKDEAECVKKLVDDIFPKSLQIISPFPESLVGMRSQVEEVIELLSMESNDARSIGISGMGGIGKSELARVLYERYRHLFEADCFLGDVGELHHKNGLAWLAQVVIRKLLGEK